MNLGRIGLWSGQLRASQFDGVREYAAELEEIGFGTLWVPGGADRDIIDDVQVLIEATQHVAIATGIVNIWAFEPDQVSVAHERFQELSLNRFVLGLGVGHARNVEGQLQRKWQRPYSEMVKFLDGLDYGAVPVPSTERVLAALGPRMLELARDRSAGAHPYLVSPAHTQFARGVLGDDAVLAPEQMVVFEEDREIARTIARSAVQRYLELPNYTNNLRRFGFGDDDFDGDGSDRLIDAIVVSGDEQAISRRVREHLDAGANHVSVQLLNTDSQFPIAAARRLAPALMELT